MKKNNLIIKAISLVTLCCLLIPMFCGCSKLGKAVLSIDKTEITENMLTFWLSRYKAQFVYAYGESIKSTYGVSSIDDFWKMEYSSEAGTTYDDLFTSYIVDNAKTYLCSLYLFDEYKLKLADSDIEEVESYLKEEIEEYAGGSKTEFNAYLAAYGFNYDTLRECYLIDKKITVLQDYLFGTGGPEAITDAVLENYYQNNYVRMEQICIFINQCPDKTDDGKYKTDDDGNIAYRDMTVAETTAARERAQTALSLISAGTSFGTVMEQYNENTESDQYTNGIYMSSDSLYSATTEISSIYETLKAMELGEVKLVELENSIHIIRKLALDTGAYKVSANSDFFKFYDSSAGDYVTFAEYVKTPLFLEYIEDRLAEFTGKIKVNEDLISKFKISTVTENYYF